MMAAAEVGEEGQKKKRRDGTQREKGEGRGVDDRLMELGAGG